MLFSFTLALAQFGPESGPLLPGVVIAWSIWQAQLGPNEPRPPDRPLPSCSLPRHRTPMGCSLPHPLPLARRQRATEREYHIGRHLVAALNQAPTTRRLCPRGGGVISRA